jgi:hypothetical protein
MRFSQRLFLIAGIFGVAILPPMYFFEDFFGRQVPPPITHPEFYYGFIGVTFAFQIVYLFIAWDPLRYRPMMLVGAFGKGSFVVALAVLVAQGRVPFGPALMVAPDLIFAVLFVHAYLVTRGLKRSPR